MSKQGKVLSYRVIVEPGRLGDFGAVSVSDSLVERDEVRRLSEYHQRCQEIVEQINRHVDSIGSATVEAETEFVCSFCGSVWTEDTDVHNGGCCDADYEAMEAAEAEEGEEGE